MVNHQLVKKALQPLVEMLLQQLTKQEEEQDKEEGIWNLSMAAGTCLGLVANTVSNDVVPLVLPFVTVSFTLPDALQHDNLLWSRSPESLSSCSQSCRKNLRTSSCRDKQTCPSASGG